MKAAQRNKTADSLSRYEYKETVYFTESGIRVTEHIPLNVPPRVRQQKINAIYDILNPAKD